MFKTLRFFMWVWLKLKHISNCLRPEISYQYVCEKSLFPTITIYKVIRRRKNGDVDEKYKLDWTCDEPNQTPSEELFRHVMPPWLMITRDDTDYTEQLHPYIAKGNMIRIYFLNKRFGEGKWKIVDPKTFEEVDFPSSGIIIK